MALFKISYGLASKLSNQQVTEGYCWFTPDDGKFYIDHKDSNGNVVRTPLNAAVASAVAWSGVTGKPNVVTGYSKGSATVPVYTNASGELQAGTTYAGGTKVKLNNSDSYGGTTATFYAPTTAGTTGQLLVSTGGAPAWQNVSAHGTHVSYSSSNPAALGTASPGTATTVARSDHIHALPALTACTGTLTVAKGGTGATDAATARTNLGITPANIGAAAASHGTHVSYGTSTANLGTAAAGTATTVSRSDHVHKMPTYSDVGAAAASHGTHVSYGASASALGTSSAGSASTVSRSDHVHALPALTSCTGTLTIAKGGTGATDAATARTNLGLEHSKIYYTIDLSSYSTNNFYFIDFGVSDFELDCEIHSNNVGSDSAYNQNHIHFLMTYNGWSDTVKTFTVLSQGSYSHTELTIMSIYAGTQNGLRGVYVRGGLIYRIFSNAKPTLNTTTKTHGAESYTSGTTSYTNVTNATQVWVNDGQAKASWSVPLYGAVWNDYAEYRATKEEIEAGRVVIENGDDTLSLAIDRLMPGANIVSDTFGFAIGETENSKTPLAVSGRALAYPYEDRDSYKPGDPVCSGPNGTVSKMTREEVMMYPDRILGTVSAIPNYENWGSGNVAVNGRIWIKVK